MVLPNILGPIADPLKHLLMLLTGGLHSYGLAIILFTILVRAALTPLYLKQMHSAKKMSLMAPQIKELQKKYKNDREALTKAQMALYKEQGANPAAGCLPLLIQMPILYALFSVFTSLKSLPNSGATAIYHQHFLWFVLDKPDHLFGAFGILPILAGATQWVQQRMMMQPTSDPQQRSTQQIMQFMPLMIVFFALQYPSGLALYWVTSTTYAIVMQYFITGWGQLFKSPFRLPEPVATPALAATSRPRRQAPAAVLVPKNGKNGKTSVSETVASDAADIGVAANDVGDAGDTAAVFAPGSGARVGKMQRVALRAAETGRPAQTRTKGGVGASASGNGKARPRPSRPRQT